MKTEIVKITPSIAESLLSTTDHNRAIDLNRVRMYRSAMERGEWKSNGESIKIDKHGRLLDGQHRLTAIVDSGLTIPMLIVSDLDYSVFDTIDSGKSRTGGDVLRIERIPNAVVISSGITFYHVLSKNRMYGMKVENQSILEEYRRHPELYQNLCLAAQSFYRLNHKILTTAEYMGFYRFFSKRFDSSVIDSFFSSISDRVGVCALLHGKLVDNVISKRKMSRVEKSAIVIKAFIYFINGKEIKQLKFQKDEKFPSLDDVQIVNA